MPHMSSAQLRSLLVTCWGSFHIGIVMMFPNMSQLKPPFRCQSSFDDLNLNATFAEMREMSLYCQKDDPFPTSCKVFRSSDPPAALRICSLRTHRNFCISDLRSKAECDKRFLPIRQRFRRCFAPSHDSVIINLSVNRGYQLARLVSSSSMTAATTLPSPLFETANGSRSSPIWTWSAIAVG